MFSFHFTTLDSNQKSGTIDEGGGKDHVSPSSSGGFRGPISLNPQHASLYSLVNLDLYIIVFSNYFVSVDRLLLVYYSNDASISLIRTYLNNIHISLIYFPLFV